MNFYWKCLFGEAASPDNLVFGEAILYILNFEASPNKIIFKVGLIRRGFTLASKIAIAVGVLTALWPANPSGVEVRVVDLQTCLW